MHLARHPKRWRERGRWNGHWLVDSQDPKFGMGLEIERGSIVETPEEELLGMWFAGYECDSTVTCTRCEKSSTHEAGCRITPSAQSG
jgi:hypothetical protein